MAKALQISIMILILIIIGFLIIFINSSGRAPVTGATVSEGDEEKEITEDKEVNEEKTQEKTSAPISSPAPIPLTPQPVPVPVPTPPPINPPIITPPTTPTPTPPTPTPTPGPYPPPCFDQMWNGDESDMDCGGICAPCLNTGIYTACWDNSDCISGNCDLTNAQRPLPAGYTIQTIRILAGQSWIIPYSGTCK